MQWRTKTATYKSHKNTSISHKDYHHDAPTGTKTQRVNKSRGTIVELSKLLGGHPNFWNTSSGHKGRNASSNSFVLRYVR